MSTRQKRIIAPFAALLMLVPSLAHATWSIVALDRKTKTVVIASATCVSAAGLAGRGGLKSIQAIVLPGIGVAAAQAGVDSTRANQQLIYDEMKKGTAPADIIAQLKTDPRIASRQFGIIDMQGRMAGFSGESNGKFSLDSQGQVPGTDVFFSVQGNILTKAEVVTDAVAALKATQGSLTDRVMAAMEAADKQGGDSRCSCDDPRNPPTAALVCSNKHAHVAYILRAEATDKTGPKYQDGEYSFFIDVTDQNTTKEEDANPVKTLRMRYDASKKKG